MELAISKRMVQRWVLLLATVFFLLICGVVFNNIIATKSHRLESTLINPLAIGVDAISATPISSTTSTFSAFPGRLITSADHLGPPSINMKSISCVTARNSGMSFPICVYAAQDDVWVSGAFIRGGYFEAETVSRVLRMLRRYPDTDLVDLGANIGTFTLPASRITHVIAVEPYSKTMMRLFKSVQMGKVEKNVSLVFNAISNERSKYLLGFFKGNKGGTYLKSAKTIDCPGGSECATSDAVTQTILLNDLLPLMRGRRAVLKVDVEGHQHQIFTEATAGKFFEIIEVPLVFMEWNNLCGRRNISSHVHALIRFFSVRNYHVFSGDNGLMGSNCSRWSRNIVFRKLSANF